MCSASHCTSLINMSDCHAVNSLEMVACGGLRFILEAMTSYSNNEEIQACGCLVLNNIFYYAKRGFIIALHRSEGLNVLQEATDNFQSSSQIYFREISKEISCFFNQMINCEFLFKKFIKIHIFFFIFFIGSIRNNIMHYVYLFFLYR